MPLYEYRCEECGAHLEILVRSGKEPEVCGRDCAKANMGEGKLTRKISRPAAVARPESMGRDVPSDKAVAEAGFTKYVKDASGAYRKTAGKGDAWLGPNSPGLP